MPLWTSLQLQISGGIIMSSWSMKFKKKLMQLQRAFLDPDTGKTYFQKESYEIHSDLLERLNEDRRANNMEHLCLPDGVLFDDWECRGFVHKETGRFMSANEAVDWAEPSKEYCDWNGEGNHLARIQERVVTEMK